MPRRDPAVVLAALSALWAGPSLGDYQQTMDALTRGLPPDATALVYRIVDCNHWGGEEPYDDARRAEIAKAMDALECNALSRDEAVLRQRYAANKAVLEAFDKARRLPE
jgi:hypothetical protein